MEEIKKLNIEQLQAVEYGQGPLLIIAGAGTGKTTVITERIKWLIFKKLAKPSEILALTFTEKASKEMEERVDIVLPMGFTQMWISTFHSFCDRILRAEALHIGLDPRYNLLTQAETIQFLRQNLFKFELNYFRPLGNPNKFIEGMIQHFSRLKDEDISPEEYLRWASRHSGKQAERAHPESLSSSSEQTDSGQARMTKRILKQVQNDKENDAEEERRKYLELAKAYRTYENLKIKESVMDFSDLIANSLKLFRTRKNILTQYQNQFKYLLVDEFQDTNFAQYELIKLLTPPNKKANLTVVGDDSQSIYKFRGAAISNILQFMEDFKSAKQIVLTKNYRSTQTILDSAHKLIKNNDPDTLEAKLGISKNLKKTREVKEITVEFIHEDRVENEAEAVAKQVLSIKNKVLSIKYSDFAILVRANNHAEPFMRALARHAIPYQFLGPGMLFKQAEVKDLIAYLKVLANFEDSVAMYRVLSMDFWKISGRDLATITNFGKRHHLFLFEALEKIKEIFVADKTRETVGKLVAIINRHLELIKKESAGQILYYFLQDSGLLQKLTQVNSVVEERQAQNISKFFDKLKTYEVNHEDASVYAVSDWIDLSFDLGESPMAADLDWTEIDAVNLLTVHAAKGLEFPVVFLVNLVSQRFPTTERHEQIPIPADLIKEILPVGDYHLEEERRLFYVGMTRARDQLFLTAADYYGEGKREKKISPFVVEALGEKVASRKQPASSEKQLSLLEWNKPKIETLNPKPYPLNPITYLTYSMIQTFEQCPLHFKARYLLGLPTPPTSALSFGTSLHAALRDFYRLRQTNEKSDEDFLMDLYEKNWLDEGYKDKKHEELTFAKGKKFLRSFLKEKSNLLAKPIAIEQPFKFKLGDLTIAGKVDRMDLQKDGTIEIIDYKTGAHVPKQEDVDRDLQLAIYALATTQVQEKPFGQKPEEISLCLYYFEPSASSGQEPGKKLFTTRSKEQLEETKKELLEWQKKISESDFGCKKSEKCKNCEYRLLCEE